MPNRPRPTLRKSLLPKTKILSLKFPPTTSPPLPPAVLVRTRVKARLCPLLRWLVPATTVVSRYFWGA